MHLELKFSCMRLFHINVLYCRMSGYQDADALWSCPPPNFYDRGMSWPRHPPPSQNRDYYFMNTSHCPPPQAPARYPLHQTLNVTHSTGNSSVDHMTHNAGQFTVDERAAPYWASANLPNISVPPPLLNNINPLSQNMAKSCSGPLPPGAQVGAFHSDLFILALCHHLLCTLLCKRLLCTLLRERLLLRLQ